MANKKIGPKDSADQGEYGYEGDMAMSQLRSIIRNAQRLHDSMEKDTDLPEWVQSKITLAEDYISTAANYLLSELEESSNADNLKKKIKEGYYKDIATNKAEDERLAKQAEKGSEKKGAKSEKIIQKFKGIKNRINKEPKIEVKGTGSMASHPAGDENVQSS